MKKPHFKFSITASKAMHDRMGDAGWSKFLMSISETIVAARAGLTPKMQRTFDRKLSRELNAVDRRIARSKAK